MSEFPPIEPNRSYCFEYPVFCRPGEFITIAMRVVQISDAGKLWIVTGIDLRTKKECKYFYEHMRGIEAIVKERKSPPAWKRRQPTSKAWKETAAWMAICGQMMQACHREETVDLIAKGGQYAVVCNHAGQ